jgi:hypothetical protein
MSYPTFQWDYIQKIVPFFFNENDRSYLAISSMIPPFSKLSHSSRKESREKEIQVHSLRNTKSVSTILLVSKSKQSN